MPTFTELVDWLTQRGAKAIKHSNKTLLDHLIGTYTYLKTSCQSEALCLAGLFHSVYGTSNFKVQTIGFDEREKVRELIGEEAEYLAWLFCKLDRPKAFIEYIESNSSLQTLPLYGGGYITLTQEQWDEFLPNLLTLEAANLLEQQMLWRNTWLVPHATKVGLLNKMGAQTKATKAEVNLDSMLTQAKSAVLLQLVNAVNLRRQSVASHYWWGDNLRTMKAMQAQRVLDAHLQNEILDDEVDLMLLKNYAESYSMSLLDAAKEILGRAEEFQVVLMQSEIAKDQLAASIRRSQDFDELGLVRDQILALAWLRCD